jgi:CxxC motif-containing protein
MEEITKLICISCPKGCSVNVTHEGETITDISGTGCKRGEDYVKKELTDPRRMVASTVRVISGLHPLVPVYTQAPLPKPRIQDLLRELRKIEVQAPVKTGQIILENALELGINVVASRDMPKV